MDLQEKQTNLQRCGEKKMGEITFTVVGFKTKDALNCIAGKTDILMTLFLWSRSNYPLLTGQKLP
jgi:hypothetical protein